jgi:hypothetical protein
LFPFSRKKKKAKGIVPLCRVIDNPTLGKKPFWLIPFFSSQEKYYTKTIPHPDLGEADPGGLGAGPQKLVSASFAFLFPEKEAKGIVSLCRKS